MSSTHDECDITVQTGKTEHPWHADRNPSRIFLISTTCRAFSEAEFVMATRLGPRAVGSPEEILAVLRRRRRILRVSGRLARCNRLGRRADSDRLSWPPRSARAWNQRGQC